MVRTILRRLVSVPAVLIAVSILTFLLMSALPGGPVIAILGTGATPENIAALTERLGLDKPLPVRYFDWLFGALRGDLGVSLSSNTPVSKLILQRLPVTLELMLLSQVLALAVAVPLAIVTAWRARRPFDRVVSALSFTALATPPFVIAVVLIVLFAVTIPLFPATGYVPIDKGLGLNLRSITLPAIALALGPCAVYTRLLRTELIGTLGQDFVTVAAAKGLNPRYVLMRHALRPSLFPLITTAGITIGSLISGAVLIESIFGLPGIGTLLVNAIYSRDYVLIQGVVLVVTVAFVLINTLVDLLYVVLDPRLRS